MVEFYVVGGCLKIQKKAFTQEMLKTDSLLRELLKWKSSTDFAGEHPLVSEPDAQGMVTIDFCNRAFVCIGDSPKDLLGKLKARYKDKVKGKVACRGEYRTFGGMFNFEIDLSSDEETIDYVNL